jgi:hypothetical protein
VSDAGAAIVARQLDEAEPFDELPAEGHVMVRSDRSLAAVAAAVADAADAFAGSHARSADRSSPREGAGLRRMTASAMPRRIGVSEQRPPCRTP